VASVRLEEVGKVYGNGHVAVERMSLEVREGELMVVVGPSGCGKSTILRLIAGLEAVTSGRVWIGDQMVNAVPPGDRDVAMVFQSYALYPHMTVAENIGFGLRLRGVSAAERDRRIAAAAERLGLERILYRRPRELSGGQRQRVALGRALVRSPQVFLFDEPLSNLDAGLRLQTRTEIARLHRQLGATMIYVTHDQVEAMTLGDRIAIMHEGRILQLDAPLALYDSPATRFVAGFLGSPAMNFLDGLIVSSDGGRFRTAERAVEFPLPPAYRSLLTERGNSPVTLGVRPEALRLLDGDVESIGCPVAEAVVELAEPLGNEVLLHTMAGGQRLTLRLPAGRPPAVGARVLIGFDTDRLHFFHPTTGVAFRQQATID
jgi:multiple sugar transport system ATP-binding protein